jgi:hypothetical protein
LKTLTSLIFQDFLVLNLNLEIRIEEPITILWNSIIWLSMACFHEQFVFSVDVFEQEF